MIDIIRQVYEFNKRAGLLGHGYSDTLESAFQIEEALEGFSLMDLDIRLNGDESNVPLTAKDMSRCIVDICYEPSEPLSDVDRLDKACDAIVFALGSMAKLGLNPDQIQRALHAVTTANLQKLDMPKDEHGKLMKPADFVGPEVELARILEE